ncbi:glutathione peroxidase [[Clostridium] polysaccharolyticum]|jgi:glutathione peroxidase|uniref:Glutathione peroxidase n=1 Tax=[Clostridium] polysaccharolyticum TaxID=29364 RepID=A0A1H9YNU6_9FIRM|nr:glutathione peroxidase [[Clostridium] polysaccharolyticum]SES70282.1 glutathione peroxidase [[Clostridium] polysaccharolyticum]
MNFYDFKAKGINGQEVKMEDYKGKAVVVVNTASDCDFASQLKGLEQLYAECKDKGLVILGFPCNQFGKKEDRSNEETKEVYEALGITFPVFEAVDVNGKTAHPLFKYLKSQDPEYFAGEIKWNFTKYFLDKEGKLVKKYAPTVLPEKMKAEIEKYL